MPRWLAHLLVVLGWLLTPGVAWGVSYTGLWLIARFARHLASPLTVLAVAVAAAALAGLGSLFFWVRFMRRLPHRLSHHMAPRPSQAQRALPSD
ncbi:MAG TPA: hypothetical protein VN848_04640 [Gemmatimonadales bacterium]|nr:hypothetical protein [Gemmatimonadales bacterium]